MLDVSGKGPMLKPGSKKSSYHIGVQEAHSPAISLDDDVDSKDEERETDDRECPDGPKGRAAICAAVAHATVARDGVVVPVHHALAMATGALNTDVAGVYVDAAFVLGAITIKKRVAQWAPATE